MYYRIEKYEWYEWAIDRVISELRMLGYGMNVKFIVGGKWDPLTQQFLYLGKKGYTFEDLFQKSADRFQKYYNGMIKPDWVKIYLKQI